MNANDPIWFPYMRFARSEAMSTSFPLTQSGMPDADPALFAELSGVDVGYPGRDALPAFQGALAERYGVAPERVLVTLGASGAMSVVAGALFGPGVRVAVETPSYEPLRALPRRAGADTREVERRLVDGWRLDPGAFELALAGARPGHVFVTSPHNPSGTRSDAATLGALAEVAGRAGGLLISNEVYEEFVEPAAAQRAAHLAPNAISIGSLTKAYGLGALRMGWIVLGQGLTGLRPRLEDALYLDVVDAPTVALRAGLHAWSRERELRRPIARVEREGKPLLRAWLEGTSGVRAVVPEQGLIVFAEIEGIDDTHALQRHLLRSEGVGVVPGEFFGRPGYLRLGCGAAPEVLAEALRRLGRGLESFRGAADRPTHAQ